MPATFDILSFSEGKSTGKTMSVPAEWENIRPNTGLIHEVSEAWRANQRQGTASTKTKSEVRGGGHKPWKQKHTGRARAGSNRSPLWRKGGITFGPKPRDFSVAVSSTKKNQALAQVLAERMKKSFYVVSEESLGSAAKTKEIASFLKTLNPKGSVLWVLSQAGENFLRASRNLAGVEVAPVSGLNAYQVLKAGTVVMTDAAWTKYLETRYAGA